MNPQECHLYLQQIQNLGMKFGLDNVREVLQSFGDPHTRYPSILVAGSNGKGSVCAMLNRMLTLSGIRVGMFTSPHLVRVEERIRIGEELISEEAFSRVLGRLKEKVEALIADRRLLNPPTYFEHLCCAAFLYFAEKGVDMALLEVGMGGRFDATNVVTPTVSVITTISAEHQKYLGNTLDRIAYEKAGIIRPGVPVVCGVKPGKAHQTIKRRAEELGAPFLGVFERRESFAVQEGERGPLFRVRLEGEDFTFASSLPGEHQGRNAAVALAAALVLRRQGFPLEKDLVVKGIETARWEGRLEVFRRKPLVLLDGAHNEEGALALRKYVLERIPEPRILVFASMRDKKVERMADILFPLARKVILTRFPFHRSASPEEIAAKAGKYAERFHLQPDPVEAYRTALRRAGSRGAVLVTGSLFLVGEIKKAGK